MKKLLLLATAFVAWSCSTADQDMSDVQLDSPKTAVSVVVSAQSQSKVGVTETPEGNLAISWISGESLGAWESNAASFTEFTMNTTTLSDDNESAEFNGYVAGDSYRLVHPYVANPQIMGGLFSIDLSAQTIDMDDEMSSMNANTYMISPTTTVNGATAPAMQHLGSAVKLSMQFTELPAEDLKIQSIVVDGINSIALVDLANDDIDDCLSVDDVITPITLTIENSAVIENADIANVIFNAFPTSIAANGEISIEVVLVDDSEATYTETFTISEADGIEIARAGYVTLNKICSMADAVVDGGEPAVIYSVGDLYPSDGTAVGIVFEISDGGAHGKVISLKEVTSSNGYCWGEASKTMGADSDDDGVANTKIMFDTYKDDLDNFATKSGAFHWVYTTMNNTSDSPWYIPAKTELMSFAAYTLGLSYEDIKDEWTGNVMPYCISDDAATAISAFVSKVSAAGGDDFTKSCKMYSSTEYGANYPWMIQFASGTGDTTLLTGQSKNATWIRTRPIMQF